MRALTAALLLGKVTVTLNSEIQVLVVDDSSAVRAVVRKILAQLGYSNVDEAWDGTAALAKLNEKPFGLVISDWHMEPMNGKALLDQVFGKKQFQKIPFIMMTTASEQYKLVAAKYPATIDFINKPFTPEELQSKISKVNAK